MNATQAIKYMAREFPRNGWTVVEREGSKRAGYVERRVARIGMTMHTAIAIAATMSRDLARHGVRAAAD